MKKQSLLIAAAALTGSLLLCSCTSTPEYNTADKDSKKQLPAFEKAIALNQNKSAEAMLAAGVPINARNPDSGWSPLISAIYFNNWEIARELIKGGADVNLGDNMRRTPLMWAAMRGNKDMVKFLIEHGAKVNDRDIYGRNAFQYAMAYKKDDLALYLIRAGRKPHTLRINTEKYEKMLEEKQKQEELDKQKSRQVEAAAVRKQQAEAAKTDNQPQSAAAEKSDKPAANTATEDAKYIIQQVPDPKK
ncbi:ankyrin repeat domain-containing protein [Lentisphaerota bacterium ZTH]|nr:ankyrin repeat domain-containing protein [Lentisphaerota bacterium]WET07459.1 ankyrin repeat domain-containing protein [Lentisphaerota bacterium ZTH]